jgi:hypothetical protein
MEHPLDEGVNGGRRVLLALRRSSSTADVRQPIFLRTALASLLIGLPVIHEYHSSFP